MFRIESENELRECFRPMDRDAVVIGREMAFPIFVRDYLAWLEPSGARTYLVFAEPASGKLLGISFRRDQSRGAAPHFCEWCHTTGGSSDIGLLTADASERKRVGIHACLSLDCVRKLEARSNLTGENSRQLARGLTAKMAEFAKKTLF